MSVLTRHQRPEQNARSARGASMIEVLIAILVTSIGLLGIAAMQTAALKTASDSYNLTQATIQAVDLEERLWAAACILSKSSAADAVSAARRIVSQWQAPPQDTWLEPPRVVRFITPASFREAVQNWVYVDPPNAPDTQFFMTAATPPTPRPSLEFPYRITWSRHDTGEGQNAFAGFTFAVQLPPRGYAFNPAFCPP